MASEFFKQVQRAGQENRIQMAEFQKPVWTYHAKGLWYTLPGHHLPTLTFIGSPNFGKYIQHSNTFTQVNFSVVTNELYYILIVLWIVEFTEYFSHRPSSHLKKLDLF